MAVLKTTKWKWGYKGQKDLFDAEVTLDLERFVKQYSEAQFWLDSQVMTSMEPYMPKQTGTFINITKAMSAALAGSGEVVAAAPPMGRFLYDGKVMVDRVTKSPWARKGTKKILTDKDLDFSKEANPKATPHWFDTAKKNHGKAWIDGVKKRAGGG